MTVDRIELLSVARAERERLGRTIQYAPASSWDNESACTGWRNRDVIAHLGAQEVAAAQVVAGEPAVEFDEFREANGDFWVDGFNEWAVVRREGLSSRQIITEWGAAADRFLVHAAKVPAEEWERARVPWVAGEIGFRYLVQSRIVEWWLHGDDVRQGTALGENLQHWPIHLTCDMGIRMLPYTLSLAGLSFPGMSVRVKLSGVGSGSWHWGLGPRETPTAGSSPDATIEGRASAFAMIAGRRVPADVYLDDGNLVIGGKEDLALATLANVRAYVE